MKTIKTHRLTLLLCFALSASAIFIVEGCKGPQTLQPGGVYAPTNSTGTVVYNDIGLALADASYKFAYDTIIGVLKFERDNRTAIFKLSPTVGLSVKQALDKVRVDTWAVDQRWALARQAYKLNPTPAGLSTVQTIVAEIGRIVPVVQSQIAPVYAVITTATATPQTP